MPGEDEFGQGYPWLDYSDAPDLREATKGIVDSMAPHTVLWFTNAAARNAAITSPQAGMQAFLTSDKELTQYDGTAWVVVAAGTSSWTTVTLASGFSHDGNDNGTFQYRRVNLFGETTVMLRGGVDLTYPGGSIANSGVLTNSALPTSVRPTSRRTITVPCSAVSSTVTSLKLDADTDGHLRLVGTGTNDKPPWAAFNTFYSL